MARLRLPAWPESWGENTRRLFRGLAAAGPFVILARALTAAAQLIAGRWMGPQEFGRVTLVVAASSVLNLVLNLGFVGCVVKFAPAEKSESGRAGVISTTLWLQLAWGFACSGALLALITPLARMLQMDAYLYGWTLAYAALLALYAFGTSALQGVLRFAERGRAEFIYGAATLALLLCGWRFSSPRFEVFIVAMDAALLLASVICFFHLRGWIAPVFSCRAAADVFSYTPPLIVFACAGVVMQAASPLILAATLSAREVGYFGAYSMGSLGVAMVLFQIIVAVLVPLASGGDRHGGAWKKFILLAPPMTIGLLAALALSTVLMLKLIGKNYPILPEWVAVFAAAGASHVIFFCALALLSIRDTRSAWLGSVGSVVMGAVCLLASLWAIGRFGFVGSALGLILGYGAGLVWCAYWGWRGVRKA